MKKIKVGAVSYLNTKPLLYGIRRSDELMQQIELIEEYPSKIADKLISGMIDIGLVPVSIIPKLDEAHIVTDFCIGANGDVASVCLFSEVPLIEIKTVLLDYQSCTSVALIKILLKEFDFALILMDVKMPNLNGFETASLIYEREKLKHIPIIFITANSYSDAAW